MLSRFNQTFSALIEALRTFRAGQQSDFVFNLIATVALQGTTLLSSIILARLLDTAAFGAYSFLVNTAMTAAMLSQAGLGYTMVKFIGESLAVDRGQVARVLRLGRIATAAGVLLTAFALMLFAQPISTLLFHSAEYLTLIYLLAGAVVFHGFALFFNGALQGFGAYRALAIAAGYSAIANLALPAVGAHWGALVMAFAGFLAASGIRALSYQWALFKVCRVFHIPAKPSRPHQPIGPIIHFALPAGLSGLALLPSLWLAPAIITQQINGLHLVALFSVCQQVRVLLLVLPQLINSVCFSALSRLKGAGDVTGYRTAFYSSLRINIAYALFMALTASLFSDQILHVYGVKYIEAKTAAIIFILSIIPETLSGSVYLLIPSAGHMYRSLLLLVAPREIFYLLLILLLLPIYGLPGVAFAYFVAATTGMLLTLILAKGLLPKPATPILE